jgi:hypothetical protein
MLAQSAFPGADDTMEVLYYACAMQCNFEHSQMRYLQFLTYNLIVLNIIFKQMNLSQYLQCFTQHF